MEQIGIHMTINPRFTYSTISPSSPSLAYPPVLALCATHYAISLAYSANALKRFTYHVTAIDPSWSRALSNMSHCPRSPVLAVVVQLHPRPLTVLTL